MKRLQSIPMRVALPVLLLSFAAIAGFISWKLDNVALGAEVEIRFIDEARLRITDWRTTIEYLSRKGDADGVNLQVSGMATRNDVRAAFVLDPEDQIMAATAAAGVGSGAGLIEADLPEDLKRRNAASLAQAKASGDGNLALSQDGRCMVAYYPLAVDVNDHALRSMRSGILVVVFDMHIAKEQAFDGAGRAIRDDTYVFSGLAACAWVFLHFALTRRVAQIVATTQRFAAGQLNARTGIDGGDELGRVARSFDLMADQIVADILGRKQAEEALQRQKTELRVLFDFIPAMVCFKDTHNGILRANRRLAEAVGKSVEEIEGRSALEIFPRESAKFYADDLEVIHSSRAKLRIIESFRDREDREVCVQTDKAPVFDQDGRVTGLVVMAQDITERKRADEELQWKTAFLVAQVNSSIDGILVVDEQGKKLLQNQRLTDLFSIPQYLADHSDDEKQRRWVTDRTKNPEQFVEKVVYLNSHRNEISRDELEMKDGTVLDRYSSPVVGPDGKYYGRIWTFRDITERKRSEESLRLLGSAVEQSKESIMITDAELDLPGPRIIFVNPAFTQMTGYKAEETLGKTPRILQGPLTDKTVLARLRQNLQRGEVFAGEAINYRKDGTEFNLEWQIAPLRNEAQAITHFVAIQRDITERKRLETQLIQSQKMETVGKLAGGIAHEFNSILTAIIGQSELLIDDLPADSPQARSVTEISQAAGRAATLTRQLLAYGRKQFLQPETLDLNRVIAGMAGIFSHLMGGEVGTQIIPAPGLHAVLADAGQIEQVIMNLIINAREAMPRGGKLTVETANVTLDEKYVSHFPESEMKAGKYVLLAISDTGAGMSAGVKARVFEPFFSTKGVGEGTGLGLATCYGIIKQSGGHISVYSEPGRGTTFKVYLPQIEAPTQAPPQRSNAPGLPRGTETVLLVEDDPALREMAATLLRRLGYTVLVAANGIEALSLKQERGNGHVDLLFTDVVMPHMNGRELADRVQAIHPDIRLLFTSAYTENAIVHQGDLNKGVALLQKPFTPSALAHKLREVLDQSVGTDEPLGSPS